MTQGSAIPNQIKPLLEKAFQAHRAGNLDAAEQGYAECLRAAPDAPPVLYLMAEVNAARGNAVLAVDHLSRLLRIMPTHGDALTLRGTCLFRLGQIDAAEASYRAALAVKPQNAVACNGIGAIFKFREQREEARDWFKKALEINPEYGEALNNLGATLCDLGEYEEGFKAIDRALALNPLHASALGNKASVLRRLGFLDEAKAMFEKALEAAPQLSNVHSNYLMCLHYIPDMPREEIFRAQCAWGSRHAPADQSRAPASFSNERNPDRSLRIGLVSSSFFRHPVGYMILPALEHLSRERLSLVAYSDTAPKRRDDLTERIRGACAEWHETGALPDPQLAEKIESEKIDILLDLTGHAEGGCRLKLFGRRAAPVQVEWIGGLFDTSGIPAMDWILGDPVEIPEGDEDWYTERIYRLPDDYICYAPPGYAPDIGPLPAYEKGYVTFGNLNNACKTNAATIALWSKILARVPDSRLLLKTNGMATEMVRERILRGFAEYGIEAERIVCEGGGPHKEFVGAYNRIDIALDPWPYTGGLTTCEGLWMGVPVVTMPGPTFAGRHAATHLVNAGLPEWVREDADAYVEWAVEQAANKTKLSTLRAGLRDKVAASPLADGKRFAANFEAALRHMWQDFCRSAG